jgi:hypothetical protein
MNGAKIRGERGSCVQAKSVTVSPDNCESVEKDLRMMNLAFDCLAHSVKILKRTAVRSVGTIGVSNNKKGVNLTNFIVLSDQMSPSLLQHIDRNS